MGGTRAGCAMRRQIGAVIALLALLEAYAKRDPYEVLGVSRHASTEDVKSRWRTIARKLHPDKQGVHKASPEEKKRIEQQFTEAQEAYEILSDSQKRQEYDEWGHTSNQQQQFRRHSGGHPF